MTLGIRNQHYYAATLSLVTSVPHPYINLTSLLELKVAVSQASLLDDEMLWRFVLFENVLVFK
jgi:hypothetical protein